MNYNTKRLHTSIDYKPPYEYLENFKKNVKEFAINSLCKLKRNSHKRGQTKIVSMLDSE